MNKKFIPYSDLSFHENVIVVDSYHPDSLTLSHWRGAPKIKEIYDDTSTGIVLNALEKGIPDLDKYPFVTNDHFDIDGFLGVWSLHYPEKALQHINLLRKMSVIGDFRELSLETEEDHLALKLVCWINKVESALFYPPFASYETGKNEMKLCVSKYNFFLTQFGKVLDSPEEFRSHWQSDYDEIVAGLATLQAGESKVTLLEDIRLLIVETPEPLHYYALFSQSKPADMVLSIYSGNRYELEYKYTTWIDCATRNSYPRIDMHPLAGLLNQHEESPQAWVCDKITDTGPILRLGGESLTKKQRFDHPKNRTIFSSGIPPEELKAIIIDYYQKAYAHTQQKPLWSWAEIRKVNKSLHPLL